jgi:hypothetical protein
MAWLYITLLYCSLISLKKLLSFIVNVNCGRESASSWPLGSWTEKGSKFSELYLYFFSLLYIFLATQRFIFVIFSSVAPHRVQPDQVPSQVATHQEIGSQVWAAEAPDSNPGLQDHQSGLLPLSHRASLSLSHHTSLSLSHHTSLHWATTPPWRATTPPYLYWCYRARHWISNYAVDDLQRLVLFLQF